MLRDAREVPRGSEIEADICVVGAGAAGITLALELRGSGLQVCLLESGGLQRDPRTQSLYQGAIDGVPYYPLDVARLRYFGGTTNHWAGLSRPLDALDFQRRPWIPYSGWPISREELDPHYERAHELCELGAFDYDPALLETESAPRLPVGEDLVVTGMDRWSPPTQFGLAYREDVERASDVAAYLNANVVEVQTDEEGRLVRRLRVATLDGNEFHVSARLFVLAAGAIENARLLLVSDGVRPHGLGNDRGLVGRFFKEHPSVVGGIFLPTDPDVPLEPYLTGAPSLPDGGRGEAFLTPTPEILERHEMLPVKVSLVRTSIQADLRAQMPGLVTAVVAARTEGLTDGLAQHVHAVARHLDNLAIYSYERMFESQVDTRGYYLRYTLDQVPDPDSRVTLTDDRDALGMRRVRLTWKVGEVERRTLREANRILARALGRAGLGRVRELEDDPDTGWPPGMRGSWHQMGTTRMSADPGRGVVDRDCRLHDVPNLYVAGSSVFSTAGYASPTVNVVALAVRLAEHLRTRAREPMASVRSLT